MDRAFGRLAALALMVTVGMVCGSRPVVSGTDGRHQEISANDFILNADVSLQSAGESERALSIDASTVQASLREALTLTINDFPLGPQHNGTVELERVRSVIDAGTRFLVKGPNGSVELAQPDIISFSGMILGSRQSEVFVNFVNGTLIATIENEGQRFSIAPVSRATKSKQRDHLLVADKAFHAGEGFNFNCAADLVAEFDDSDADRSHTHRHTKASGGRLSADELLEVQVAVECDSYLYASLGSDHELQSAYVTAIFQMVSRIYEENIGVVFYLPYVYLYADSGTDPDPYSAAAGELDVMLGEFASYWQSSRGAVNRDFAHLMTSYPAGGGVVGIAYTGNNYRGAVCRTSRFGGGYGVSGIRGGENFPTLDYTSDVYVVSHEIGHNFGAPHTHNCFWLQNGYGRLIDTCVTQRTSGASDGCLDMNEVPAAGTIMSYCRNVNNTGAVNMEFHPWVRDHMRNNAEDFSCLSQPQSPVVKMQHPVGNTQYRAGSSIAISWVSARITSVKLEYSGDGGTNWTAITTLSAAAGRYDWQTPLISSEEVLIRISDASNPAVNDVTIARFALLAPFVQVLHPNGGEEISNMANYDITWDSRFVDEVQIQFSPDNGQNWETIASNRSSGAFEWVVPDINTSAALIRIIDQTNNQIIDQSDASFAIGSPLLELQAPLGGEKWLLGSVQSIRWNSRFVDYVRIEYSTDMGNSWNRLGFRALAADGVYEWNIPDNENLVTDQGLVRIRNLDELSADGIINTSPFSLVQTISSLGETGPDGVASSVRIVPNPAGSLTNIIFNAAVDVKELHIGIQDLTGRKVLDGGSYENVQRGDHVFSVDTAGLSPGVYFVVLQSGPERIVQRLSIVR